VPPYTQRVLRDLHARLRATAAVVDGVRCPGNAVEDGSYFPSEAAQASDLAEAYADLLGLPFVRAALWFDLRDYQPGIQSPDPSFFYHYGLFDYDYTPKAAASEFHALAAANPGR
jgi:hypothetical protein